MYKARAVTQVITMIAVFLCWLFFADAQSTCKEKPTEEKITEESQKDSKEGREIDFFTGGDDNLQSFNFMIKLPFDEEPFKFEKVEGFLSGESFMTFRKPEREDPSAWARLWKEYSGMEIASRSYALRVEGSPGLRIVSYAT